MQISGVLETCLYATDLEAAEGFYARVLGLAVFSRDPGRHVFFRCGAGMLLVFNPARTSSTPGQVSGVAVPAHGARGPGHVAFRIPETGYEAWRARLLAAGLDLEAEITWPRGGRSLYVRDPEGNSVEVASGIIWGLPEPPAAGA